jgi:predicted RNA-binding protein
VCEFDVVLDGTTVFKDVVYAKTYNNSVTVKTVVGETKKFENCKITEVDVNSTRLVLIALNRRKEIFHSPYLQSKIFSEKQIVFLKSIRTRRTRW